MVLELLVVGAQVGALVSQWPSLAELTRTFGRSDGCGLLPEARVDEAAPHRGLVEELHVAVRPAGKDGKIAVVPLVVDAVKVRMEQQSRVLRPPHYDWQGVRRVVTFMTPAWDRVDGWGRSVERRTPIGHQKWVRCAWAVMIQDRATTRQSHGSISPASHAMSATEAPSVPSASSCFWLLDRFVTARGHGREWWIWNFQTNFSQSVAVVNCGLASAARAACTDVGITSRSRSPASAWSNVKWKVPEFTSASVGFQDALPKRVQPKR